MKMAVALRARFPLHYRMIETLRAALPEHWLVVRLSGFLRERGGTLVLVYASYLGAAFASISLYHVVDLMPSVIWLPAGVTLAAAIIEGYYIWPAILLGSLTVNLYLGTPPLILTGTVIMNTLQPLVGRYILQIFNFDRKLSTSKDMFVFMATAIGVTALSPVLATLVVHAHNALFGANFPSAWAMWWAGNAFSALAITPFLIRWIKRPLPKRTPSQIAEIVAANVLLAAVCVAAFGTTHTSIFGISLIFPLIGILTWMAFRLGPRLMTFSLLFFCGISVVGALYGAHAPSSATLAERVINTQIFDMLMIFFFFMLVSLEEQRRAASAELHERANALEDALQRIQLEEQAKNEFLAMLAHELRNPLASILSSTELLRSKSGSAAEVRRLSDIMTLRVKTMARLLDDLLDVSHISGKKLQMKRERVDVHEIMQRSVEAVDPLIRKQGHELAFSVPEERAIIEADPVRLEQIFVNILSNAAKYTPPEGQIQFTSRLAEADVCISVRDSGVGIPRVMLTRIFDPFVRIRSRAQATEGIGIGLSLAKNLVELHGGTIVAHSHGYNRGSEFVIRLPLLAREKKSIQRKVPTPLKEDQRASFRILVVDDNVEAADALSRLLTLKGHIVSVAHDGEGALRAVSDGSPQVVFLDIGLPDMDGYEVAAQIRSAELPVYLIALTGYGQQEDKNKALLAGFDRHLTKPVGIADIESMLKNIEQSGHITPLFETV